MFQTAEPSLSRLRQEQLVKDISSKRNECTLHADGNSNRRCGISLQAGSQAYVIAYNNEGDVITGVDVLVYVLRPGSGSTTTVKINP